ncbi:MAG TPA: amidohydrolase family protein [Vicinamibacterales bacterium]|nr:amidohydrolase family protein [Vicinamibacterales bacterium]
MRWICCVVGLLSGIVGAQVSPPPPASIAIRHVNVIVGDGTAAIPAQTVLIRGEHIAAIGPAADVVVPRGTTILEGRGRFLMPGLIDLHVHLSKARGSALGLFVTNGVTTVRDMGGDLEELLRWRRDVNAGTRVGPRMVIAGPYLESTRNIERMRKDPPEERVEPFERTRIGVGSPEAARRIVADLASREVDFLKIRTIENQETYKALNAAARAHGLRLVGHVSGIPPQVVLDAGQGGIDHAFYPSMEGSRENRMAVWRQFAARGVPGVPTLVTLFETTFPPIAQLKAMVQDDRGTIDPRRAYLSRYLVQDWREQVSEASDERTAALRKIYNDIVRRDLREMHEAGMDLLAGSDVAALNIFPGFSLHDEIALMVREIGLTPSEAIARATGRSAAFLGLDDSIGTVQRGKIADLVLLDQDPTTDISHTKRIVSVFLRGRLYGTQELDTLRAGVRDAADRRVDDWGRTR